MPSRNVAWPLQPSMTPIRGTNASRASIDRVAGAKHFRYRGRLGKAARFLALSPGDLKPSSGRLAKSISKRGSKTANAALESLDLLDELTRQRLAERRQVTSERRRCWSAISATIPLSRVRPKKPLFAFRQSGDPLIESRQILLCQHHQRQS